MNPIDEINLCKFLFLAELEELPGNDLRLVVEEGQATGSPKSVRMGDAIVGNAQPIKANPDSAWEVLFQTYIAYLVRNESYVTGDLSETWQGTRLRTYSKSKFLEHVRASTFATDDFPGPLCHHEVVCED